jgi:hypothetical protein
MDKRRGSSREWASLFFQLGKGGFAMKRVKSLGFFVALALVTTTGCGSKEEKAPQENPLPKQVVELPAQDAGVKEAEPKSQESAEGAKKQDPNTPVSKKTEGSKQTAPAASNGGGQSSPGYAGSATAPAASSGGEAAQAQPKQQKAGQFQLFVTENFGQRQVFHSSVGYAQGQSLLDVMREHLEIETSYGGGFINAINGTKSGYTDKSIFTRKKRDWFYYVNGSIAAVGADAYAAKSGDEVWWDYHDWSGSGSSAYCVVGSYPHPFTLGYNGSAPGTVVYYGSGHAEEANRVASALTAAGAGRVRTAVYNNEDLMAAGTNTVVVGTWAELSGKSNIAELFGAPTRTGLYAAFEGDRVIGLNYQGKGTEVSGAGAILATGSGNGDPTPTWLIIGATEAGLDAAVNTLVHNPGALRGKIGALVDGGTVTGVPVAP